MAETLTALPTLPDLPDCSDMHHHASDISIPDVPLMAGAEHVARARAAQAVWALVPLPQRLHLLRTLRSLLVEHSEELVSSIARAAATANRNAADSMVAEVLPLAEACRYLEREARNILRSIKLGRRGRPAWLRGVASEVHRVPLGVVLVIAPSNYPLFLPGVQALQALAAGNAVLWKPAEGGEYAAIALAQLLAQAGLPKDVLQIMDSSIKAGADALRAGVDKVFLTGHADTGRAVMHVAAETLTPSVMELSGCDAVFILPGADIARVVEALAFGLRFNGSATCMAPRRVFAPEQVIETVLRKLVPAADDIAPARVTAQAATLLDEMVNNAVRHGARVVRDGRRGLTISPTLLSGVRPEDAVMQTDIFAPVLAFCAVADHDSALRADATCPYALTAAVFGPAKEAAQLAEKIQAGSVLINDLIVATADPRVPFGGRKRSGFGVTRGREGLLEMTAIKTVLRQDSRSLRPYARTGEKHLPFFRAFVQTVNAGSFAGRVAGARKLFATARDLSADPAAAATLVDTGRKKDDTGCM